ncbi:hypothetical protein L249_5629, partial [Ophiocordyceps polyrhachis-furcata BCC 54312]
ERGNFIGKGKEEGGEKEVKKKKKRNHVMVLYVRVLQVGTLKYLEKYLYS